MKSKNHDLIGRKKEKKDGDVEKDVKEETCDLHALSNKKFS